MDYPVQYQSQILSAIQGIDLGKVGQVIEVFKAARAHGRRIFLCGTGGTDSMLSQFLCQMVTTANLNRSLRFRILALNDRAALTGPLCNDSVNDRAFVEQLKNFAEPEDVVMGICTSGNDANVVNAIEYACWIGCRTIAITGHDGGEAARMAELTIQVPVNHLGSTEDAHMVICHMIGYYFVDFENAAKQRTRRTS